MPPTSLPETLNCIKKRDLLYSPRVSPEELREWGRHFLGEGLLVDALNFFAKVNDAEGLEACKRAAIEQADHDVLWKVGHSEAGEVSEADWRACAERAIEMSKFRTAAYIFERLEDWGAFDRLPEELDPRRKEE